VVSLGGGYYELIHKNSGKALDVPGRSTTGRVFLQQYTINGRSNQLWSF
jgi:hypothetical protein